MSDCICFGPPMDECPEHGTLPISKIVDAVWVRLVHFEPGAGLKWLFPAAEPVKAGNYVIYDADAEGVRPIRREEAGELVALEDSRPHEIERELDE